MQNHFLIGLSVFLLSASSFAEETVLAGKREMQTLYDEGIRLMHAKDYEKACPMIEKATQMAPEGLEAKWTLAECHEAQGKLANAYATFVLVEQTAKEKGQLDKSKKAAARMEALRPKLGQITFTGDQAVANGHDLRVELDGVVLASPLTETHYVDAGTHHIVASSKGVPSSDRTIDVTAGASEEITVEDLLNLSENQVDASSSPPEKTTPDWGRTTEPLTPQVPTERISDAKRGFPVWQTVVGGMGLAAIGAGIAFKMDSVAAENKLVAHCGADLICPRDSWYSPFDDNARKNRSFGAFLGFAAVGSMAIGTAVVGLIRWRNPRQTPRSGLLVLPTYSPTQSGVIFSGGF